MAEKSRVLFIGGPTQIADLPSVVAALFDSSLFQKSDSRSCPPLRTKNLTPSSLQAHFQEALGGLSGCWKTPRGWKDADAVAVVDGRSTILWNTNRLRSGRNMYT